MQVMLTWYRNCPYLNLLPLSQHVSIYHTCILPVLQRALKLRAAYTGSIPFTPNVRSRGGELKGKEWMSLSNWRFEPEFLQSRSGILLTSLSRKRRQSRGCTSCILMGQTICIWNQNVDLDCLPVFDCLKLGAIEGNSVLHYSSVPSLFGSERASSETSDSSYWNQSNNRLGRPWTFQKTKLLCGVAALDALPL